MGRICRLLTERPHTGIEVPLSGMVQTALPSWCLIKTKLPQICRQQQQTCDYNLFELLDFIPKMATSDLINLTWLPNLYVRKWLTSLFISPLLFTVSVYQDGKRKRQRQTDKERSDMRPWDGLPVSLYSQLAGVSLSGTLFKHCILLGKLSVCLQCGSWTLQWVVSFEEICFISRVYFRFI